MSENIETEDKFIRTFIINGAWCGNLPDYVVEEFQEGKPKQVYGDCGTKLSTLIADIKRKHKTWDCKVTHKKGCGEWVIVCTKTVKLSKEEIEKRKKATKTLQTIAEVAGR